MKKFYTSVLLLAGLGISNVSDAQRGFSVTLKAAPQFSFLKNEDDQNNKSHHNKATLNATVGTGADYGFTNHLGIGIDAILSFQGQRYSLNNTEYNQQVNYVKVPVYFAYTSDASKAIAFLGKIGPQISFVSDANLSDKDGNKIVKDTKDRYKTTTFGGVAVAGAQYKLSRQVFISTALRFDYDFTNAEENTYPGYASGRTKTYNSTAGLEVALKYMVE